MVGRFSSFSFGQCCHWCIDGYAGLAGYADDGRPHCAVENVCRAPVTLEQVEALSAEGIFKLIVARKAL